MSVVAPATPRGDAPWRRWVVRRPDVEVEAPRWLAMVSVIAVLAVHAAVAWGTLVPHFAADEIGMLGNSLVLAGGEPWDLIGAGYGPGLAFLMAPLWWITEDASDIFRWSLGLNVALAAVAVWPLSRLAVRAGARPRMAVVISAVVMIAPARALIANYLLAETLLVVATATAVVAAARLSEKPTYARAVLLGLTVGATFLVHGRSMMLALAAGIWCLTMLARWRWVAVAAGATALVATLGAYATFVAVTTPLYRAENRTSTTLDQIAAAEPVRAAASAVGQVWYATFAWPAVAVAGLAWLAWRWRATSWVRLLLLAVPLTILLAVGTVHESAALPEPRLDLWVYGRYGDHLFTVVATLGAAVLTRVRWPAVSAAVVGASGLVAGVFAVVTAPRLPVGGWFVDAHVAGLAPFLNVDNVYDKQPEPWGVLAAAAVLFAALVVAAAWVRGSHLLVLALLWTGTGLLHDASLDARDLFRNASAGDPTGFEEVPQDVPIVALVDLGNGVNTLAYRLHPRDVTVISVEEAAGYPLVFGPNSSAEMADLGFDWYTPIGGVFSAMWIAPGPFYDEAASQGLVVEPDRELIDGFAQLREDRNAADTRAG